MADNTINIKVKIDDKGNLSVLGKKAKAAGEGLERTAKGAQTADRNLKGAARTSSNSTKNFSKMAQGISGGLVPAYATLAAQVFAVTAAFQFLQNAFDFTNLIRGQEALTLTTGVGYKTISNALVEATEGQLKYSEAARAAAIGTAAGLTSGQLTELGTAAKNVSLALGRDLTDSFNRLVRGVTKAEPELLDELGIILRLDTATRNYAAAIGKPVSQLTTFEKSQAVVNEVLTQAEQKFSALEEVMDPDAFALNQFTRSFDELLNTLRRGITEGLTPVFQFLNKNTGALVAALALFAVPIVKSIIPNLEDWGTSATEAAKKQKEAYQESAANLKKLTSVTEAEFTKQKSVSKLQKRLQGLEFRKGSAGAQLQSGEQISLRQAVGLRSSLEKETGAFKGIDPRAKQRIKADLDNIVNNSKKATDTIKRHWKTTGGVLKIASAGVGTAWKGAMRGIATASAFAAKAVDKAFKAISFIGILFLIKDFAVQAYNFIQEKFFNKVKEGNDELALQTERVLGKYSSLEEELSRSRQGRDLGIMSLRQEVESLGNALATADVLNFALDINEIDRSSTEAVATLSGIASELVKIDKEFQPLLTSLESGADLTEAQIAELTKLSNSYIEASQASQNLVRSQEQLTADLQKLIGTPTATIVDQVLQTSQSRLQESVTVLNAAQKRIDSELAKIETATDEVKEFVRQGLGEQEQLDALNETVVTNVTNFTNLARIRQTLLENQDTQLRNEREILKQTTLGITFEDKKINLQTKALARDNKVLQARQAIIGAEAKLEGLRQQGVDAQDVRLLGAERELALAEERLGVVEDQNFLDEMRQEMEEYQLDTQERLLKNKYDQLAATKQLNALQLQRLRIESGIVSFGFTQARQQRENEIRALKAQRLVASQELEAARIRLSRREFSDPNQIQADEAAEVAALQRIATLNQQLNIQERIADSTINSVKAENELTQAKINAISFNPIQQAFEEKLIDLKKQGVELSLIDQENLLNEITAQQELMLLLENKQQIFTSITDNISNGLTSIIDGTKSVKQAFADMALNILRDIAQMIVKMMVFRAVSSFLLPAGPTLPPSFGSLDAASSINTAGVARNGGVFSEGRKMSYGVGGIARGPNSGYPVTLHGTEAVVPLPDGKSIPVQMSGTNQQNNVTVNVAIDNQGNASTNVDQGGQGADIGRAVARAVQIELQNQKRSGGILSPYGAA